MSRLLLEALLFASLMLGTAAPALAIDYQEPFVPPQFLMAQPAPVAPAETSTITLLRLQEGESPRSAVPASPASAGAGGAAMGPAVGSGGAGYGSSGCSDIGGRALWDWNAC
jgi:hypothetical protein